MTINLNCTNSDDREFIRLVEYAISEATDDFLPENVYVITVDRWFDHKWANFSGIGVVYFESANIPGSNVDAALDELWKGKTTFPPFTPKRIFEERFFVRNDDRTYKETIASQKVHPLQRTHSSANLHRRVSDFSESALFAWYSSETATNDRGSLMVYISRQKKVETWFASFIKRSEWKLDKVKGINRDKILASVRVPA